MIQRPGVFSSSFKCRISITNSEKACSYIHGLLIHRSARSYVYSQFKITQKELSARERWLSWTLFGVWQSKTYFASPLMPIAVVNTCEFLAAAHLKVSKTLIKFKGSILTIHRTWTFWPDWVGDVWHCFHRRIERGSRHLSFRSLLQWSAITLTMRCIQILPSIAV